MVRMVFLVLQMSNYLIPILGRIITEIIEEVSLYSIDDFYTASLGSRESLRITLEYTVVGYGHSPVAPRCRALNKFSGVRHGIERRHVAVHMKLNALLRRVICALNLCDLSYSFRLKHIFLLVAVVNYIAEDYYGYAVLKFFKEAFDI